MDWSTNPPKKICFIKNKQIQQKFNCFRKINLNKLEKY